MKKSASHNTLAAGRKTKAQLEEEALKKIEGMKKRQN